MSPIIPGTQGQASAFSLRLLPWVGHLRLWPWLTGPHVSPCPTISRRLFLTRKCCHLPPPWGSLHASLPGLGQGSPNLLARPRLLLLASCLPPLPFGPPKGNSDHLLQPGPKWDPRPPRSDNSCQSFQCLFECHFLRETFREPPASVPTETRIHVSCVYHAVRVWQDSVPPLRALLPPQPWCVGCLAKQRLCLLAEILPKGSGQRWH